MTTEQALQATAPLSVPALRAFMGDWTYYAAFLKLKDVAQRISYADEVHTHSGLRDMIQRSIDKSGHAESIRRYLLTNEQRFFNALVIGVYGGEPDFFELELQSGLRLQQEELPSHIDGALGILRFNGAEKLFAIDGQHRVAGIKRALEQSEQLGKEEVVALFVAHSRTADGMERTRRLFTTLNRYAKPVSKMDIIALDEDDIVAIITRRLVEEYPLFKNFLKIKKGKQLPRTDVESFTTIETLYESLDSYLQDQEEWGDYKRSRPSEASITKYYRKAVDLWDRLQGAFPQVKYLAESEPGARAAADFRGSEGGHLMFRPIGLLIVVDVIAEFLEQGRPLGPIVNKLSRAPMELSAAPWAELLWNPSRRTMIVASENRRIAARILYYGLGGDLAKLKVTPTELRDEWAGAINRQRADVHLRRWR